MTFAALKQLEQDPRVKRISVDHPMQGSLATTAKAVGADLVWALQLDKKTTITGSGVTVAVIDSGISGGSGDLKKAIIRNEVFTQASDVPDDLYGHGTHVAGIVAGSGDASKKTVGYPAQYKGIAYGANIINLKVLDGSGAGLTSSVLQALDWCIRNRSKYNIRVINLSLGHPVYESYKTDPLCQMVESCVRNGIVVVASAGNYGKAADGSTLYGGISSPGNDPAAITVGAVNTHDTPARSDDTIATYSSCGPTAIDGLIKPDIVAPGNKVVSVRRTANGSVVSGLPKPPDDILSNGANQPRMTISS